MTGMAKRSNWGGARKGAGRKPAPPKPTATTPGSSTVRIDADVVHLLDEQRGPESRRSFVSRTLRDALT